MQFTGVSQSVAPLATGHPLSLPASPIKAAPETRVQPVSKQAKTGAEAGQDGQDRPAAQRQPGGDTVPVDRAAPPSIMQLKISALLQEQAEKLMDEAKRRTAQQDPEEARDTQDRTEGAHHANANPEETAPASEGASPFTGRGIDPAADQSDTTEEISTEDALQTTLPGDTP